jgi:hypothetical protein
VQILLHQAANPNLGTKSHVGRPAQNSRNDDQNVDTEQVPGNGRVLQTVRVFAVYEALGFMLKLGDGPVALEEIPGVHSNVRGGGWDLQGGRDHYFAVFQRK